MTDILEPPAPATVADAITQANAIAYGFAKHTNDGYWDRLYLNDRAYAWSRMLGYLLQADSPDVARAGKYAFPPSPWFGAPVDPPAPPPVDPPPSPDPVLARLDALEAQIADVKGLILAIAQRPAPPYAGQVGPFAIRLEPAP